jgi:hypothetical protein
VLTVLRGPGESLSDVILRLVGASRPEKARGTLRLVAEPPCHGAHVKRTLWILAVNASVGIASFKQTRPGRNRACGPAVSES